MTEGIASAGKDMTKVMLLSAEEYSSVGLSGPPYMLSLTLLNETLFAEATF